MIDPTTIPGLASALDMHRRGDLHGAELGYQRVLEQCGANSDAEQMLGMALHQQGRSDEAVPWFERAVAHAEGVSLWVNYASVLLALGRGLEAEMLCLRAKGLDPEHFGASLNLGLSLEIQQRLPEAIDVLGRALEIAPDAVIARRALARCHIRAGAAQRGLQILQPVVCGTDPQADLLRCEAWIMCGGYAQAHAVLQQLGNATVSETDAIWLQAELALRERNSDAAFDFLQTILARDPENRQAAMKMASLQLGRGNVESSLATMEGWLTRHPDDHHARSGYLVTCQYSERFDAAALLTEHRLWQAPRIDAGPKAPTTDASRSSRPLRVGWVSPRFCNGPVETFFAEVLMKLRAFGDIHHVLYMAGIATPDATAHFRRIAPEWRDVAFLSDAQLLQAVRDDAIDVLVDLVGHGPGNRLSIFAARGAPVQISWLDYFCTTGLDAMDYLITDSYLSPPGSDAHFSERLLRMHRGRLCYSPPPAPPPAAAGADSRRLICLNRFSKLNDAVIALWAEAMRRLPDWGLRLKAAGGDDAGVVNSLHRRFANHGVLPKRVEISGVGPYAAAIAAYQDAAIALDPFPFSGCATTFDALWMGLPVVTWPRDTLASRQSADLLAAVGCDDWIVNDGAAYVAKVVELAQSDASRHRWRECARERITPVLTDSVAFAQELSLMLQQVGRVRTPLPPMRDMADGTASLS